MSRFTHFLGKFSKIKKSAGVKKLTNIMSGGHIGSDLQKVLLKVLFLALFLGKELFLALFWALLIVRELFFALFCALFLALF